MEEITKLFSKPIIKYEFEGKVYTAQISKVPFLRPDMASEYMRDHIYYIMIDTFGQSIKMVLGITTTRVPDSYVMDNMVMRGEYKWDDEIRQIWVSASLTDRIFIDNISDIEVIPPEPDPIIPEPVKSNDPLKNYANFKGSVHNGND